jgi:hypothetical protein
MRKVGRFFAGRCVELLRQWSQEPHFELSCIKGNAEFYLLTPQLDELPRKDEPSNHDLVQLIQWYQEHLSEIDLEWIRSLPDFMRWNEVCLVHDSPLDRLSPQSWYKPEIELKYQEWFYHAPGIRQDMTEYEWQQIVCFMQEQNLQQVFCGHTHIPFYRNFNGMQFCNVGSVGAPLDGDPRPSWVLVEAETAGEQAITIQRVAYDISQIHQMIDRTPDYPGFKVTGIQDAYKKWLASGMHWRVFLSS